VFLLSKKLKLNLNSRLVVIVLRLAKPLRENTQQNRSEKVKVTQSVMVLWHLKIVALMARRLGWAGDPDRLDGPCHRLKLGRLWRFESWPVGCRCCEAFVHCRMAVFYYEWEIRN